MSDEHISTLITDACALLEDPRTDPENAFMQLATLRVELLAAAAAAAEPELIDDCCDMAAQLEERLVAVEASLQELAASA